MSLPRSQIRLEQLTGSIPSDVLAKVADKDTINNTSLSGTIDHLASAIKRLHGFSAFTGNDPGSFSTNVYITGSLLDFNQAATLQTAAGDITLTSAAASVNVVGVEADAAAVKIHASDAAGGIDIDSGTGGIDVLTTGGYTINGQAASELKVTTGGADADDLTISVTGGGDSSLLLTSDGTGADSVSIDTTAGSMVIAPSLADGQTLKLGKNGAVEMVFTPHGTAANEKFSLTNTSGDAADAIAITATAGGVDIDGSSVTIDALDAGSIDIGVSAAGASDTSAINIGTSATARTITVGNDASTKVDVNALNIELDSAGPVVVDATTGVTLGGASIDIDADGGAGSGEIAIDTTDTTNGIKIGTALASVPITIGHGTSMVTIGDDLTVEGNINVKGDLATVNTTNLHVEDTALLLGSGSTSAGDIGLVLRHTATAGKLMAWDNDASAFVFGSVDNDPAVLAGESNDLTPDSLDNVRVGRLQIDSANDYIDVDTDLTLVAAADILLDPVGLDVKADANIIPNSDDARDLGMEDNGVSRRWRDGYFSRNLFVSGALSSRGSALHLTASTTAGSKITFGDGFSGVEGMGGGNNGRITLAASGDYTEFIAAFSNTTTIVGALNILAAGAASKFSGSVGNVNIIPQGSNPGTFPIARDTQIHIKDMVLDQDGLGKVDDNNTNVFLNGAMLMSGSAELITAGVHADYVIIGSGSLKFGFQVEKDDVITVIQN